MEFLDTLLDYDSCESFTSNNRKLDKSGHFYHVTQQCYSFGSTFSLNSAKYRMHIIHSVCAKNKVIALCNVVMPNHTHDVFYSPEFVNIQNSLKIINTVVAKYIRKERNAVKRNTEPVFLDLPYYENISSKEHLFYLFKYLYENPQYLKKDNRFVPYSCFDQWQNGYFKPYKTEVYKHLFDKDLVDITNMCVNLSKEEFRKEAKRLYGGQNLK